MSDDHGIDVDEDAAVETADDDQADPDADPETTGEPDEPGREDADSEVRETDAEEITNPDNHRDEPPHES